MENSWADAMVQGKDVKIEVEAVFTGTSKVMLLKLAIGLME